MKQKPVSAKWILWIIVFAIMLWIFSNSLTTGASSSSKSAAVTRFLLRLLHQAGFTITFGQFHFYVRKLAHFSEYALLGFFTIWALHEGTLLPSPVLNYFLFCLVPPFLDEGIQLFTDGRNASVRDCLIDISGFLAGSFLMYVLLLIISDIQRRHSPAGSK